MLKNLTLLTLVATSLLVSNVALAQDSAAPVIKLPNVGIGTRLDTLLLNLSGLGALGGNTAAATIYVPIDVSPMFRVEPFLAHVSTSTTTEPTTGTNVERSDSQTTLGVGLFYTFAISERSRGYAGGRLGLLFEGEERTNNNVTTSTDATRLLIAPTLGAEYFFAISWSVGADVSLSVNTILSEDTEPDDDETLKATTINTGSGLFLRFYLL
jgi:hypothetical protein